MQLDAEIIHSKDKKKLIKPSLSPFDYFLEKTLSSLIKFLENYTLNHPDFKATFTCKIIVTADITTVDYKLDFLQTLNSFKGYFDFYCDNNQLSLKNLYKYLIKDAKSQFSSKIEYIQNNSENKEYIRFRDYKINIIYLYFSFLKKLSYSFPHFIDAKNLLLLNIFNELEGILNEKIQGNDYFFYNPHHDENIESHYSKKWRQIYLDRVEYINKIKDLDTFFEKKPSNLSLIPNISYLTITSLNSKLYNLIEDHFTCRHLLCFFIHSYSKSFRNSGEAKLNLKSSIEKSFHPTSYSFYLHSLFSRTVPLFPLCLLYEMDKDEIFFTIGIKRPEFIGLRKNELKLLPKNSLHHYLRLDTLLKEYKENALQGKDPNCYFHHGYVFYGLTQSMIEVAFKLVAKIFSYFQDIHFLTQGFAKTTLSEWDNFQKNFPAIFCKPSLFEPRLDPFDSHSFNKINAEIISNSSDKTFLTSLQYTNYLSNNKQDDGPKNIKDIKDNPFEPKFLVLEKPQVLSNCSVSTLVKYEIIVENKPQNSMESVITVPMEELWNSAFFWEDLQKIAFKPHPYFVVGDKEYNIQQWAMGKISGDFFILKDSTNIPIDEYNKVMETFILRKKAFENIHTLKTSELWNFHKKTFGNFDFSSSQKIDVRSYLESLKLQIGESYFSKLQDIQLKIKNSLAKSSDPFFTKILRNYQLEGVAWALCTLKSGLGALLADDMGLGKTIQAIGVLKIVLETKKDSKILILSPKSVLYNWHQELKKYLNPNSHQSIFIWDSVHLDLNSTIILSSWPRLRQGVESLQDVTFDLIIADEAQYIKNSETKLSKALHTLKAHQKLALTGTPIENSATDLWNLVDWLNLNYLGNKSHFKQFVEMATNPKEKELSLIPIHNVMKPILLRRLKNDPNIELNLPDKIEKNYYYELSKIQTSLYKGILDALFNDELTANLSLFTRNSLYLKAILRLKQICNHPHLFFKSIQDKKEMDDLENKEQPQEVNYLASFNLSKKIEARLEKLVNQFQKQYLNSESGTLEALTSLSGKLEHLMEIIENLEFNKGGILIFSQFISSFELISCSLKHLDPITYKDISIFEGSLSNDKRMQMIQDFHTKCLYQINNPQQRPPILLLSLKAGGLGINLTGANQVIHFDRWWNPAVENQATDRAYRFGQEKDVTVHQFIGINTIEESLENILHSKINLANDLLGSNNENPLKTIHSHEDFLSLVDPKGKFRI